MTVEGGLSDEYIDKLLNERIEAAVNAYIVGEVIDNIYSDRSVAREYRNDAVELFSRIISDCSCINNPTQEAVGNMDRKEHRKQNYNQLIGALGDIQPKDAPVLLLAYSHINKSPTILTDDKEFSEFEPDKYGLSELSVERVKLEWDEIEQRKYTN